MGELTGSEKQLYPAREGDMKLLRLTERAAAALERRLARTQELSPRALAETVAAALPPKLGKWLVGRLEGLGWLRPDAALPFDILDRLECPAQLRGRLRPVVQLALFGPGGQGLSSRDKRREALYQQLCSEIMRTAVDTASLQAVANRTMNHPDVVSDTMLASMLRTFIAQREAVLRDSRSTPDEEHYQRQRQSKLESAFEHRPGTHFPTRSELLGIFQRFQSEFDAAIAQFEERRADQVLDKLRSLRRRFPVHIPAADLQRCEEQYDRFLKRAGVYRRQIKELATQATAAAAAGDEKTAAWIIRRLHAIHALLPTLLSVERLEELRAQITQSSQQHESQEIVEELMGREREVVAEIKNLAGIIHRFHQLALHLPPGDQRLRRAEINYRRAVQRIRELDTDWLASLILQLETLLDDLDDPGSAAHNKLDQFIVNVRTALNRLRLEIRAIHSRRGTSPNKPPEPPSDGAAPPQPA